MLLKKHKKLWLSTFVLVSGCAVTIPDVELCSSIGSRGAICQNTNSENKRRMSFDQWYDFLEADQDKGPALCLSSTDFTALKTSIQTLCKNAGRRCTYEQKKTIERIERFQKFLMK